jgi:hypothetical protein
MICYLVGVGAFLAVYVAYHVGYMRGYKTGLAYGMKKLKEFHEYVLANMRSLL